MKSIVLIILLLTASVSFADISVSYVREDHLQKIMEQLWLEFKPCDLYDLTLPEDFTKSLSFDYHANMPLRNLRVLADELNLGGSFADYFKPNPRIYRPVSEKVFFRLVKILEESEILEINLSELAIVAQKKFATEQNNNKLGHCYFIQVFHQPILKSKLAIELPQQAELAIYNLFKQNPKLNFENLNKTEQQMYSTNRLLLEEIKELRAIRKASALYEQSTLLKDGVFPD